MVSEEIGRFLAVAPPQLVAGQFPVRGSRLHLPEADFRYLFTLFGPSLGLWRGAEVAALREQISRMERPVLDLGCGDGIVTSLVLPRVAIGLDPAHSALARAAALRTYERLQPVTVEDAQLPAGSIGTVISNSVLEHVPNVDEALAAAARLLRPGGWLIFTVPTEAFGPSLLLPFGRYRSWRNEQLMHLNLWPLGEWQTRLSAAGLDVEYVRPYLGHNLVAAWDALELMQQVWIGRRRAFGLFWRHVPHSLVRTLARRAARLDLSAPAPGGGRLVMARKN